MKYYDGRLLDTVTADTATVCPPQRRRRFHGRTGSNIVVRLLDMTGYQIKKRFGVDPTRGALNAALAGALAETMQQLADVLDVMEHYLDLFGEWIRYERVAGELS